MESIPEFPAGATVWPKKDSSVIFFRKQTVLASFISPVQNGARYLWLAAEDGSPRSYMADGWTTEEPSAEELQRREDLRRQEIKGRGLVFFCKLSKVDSMRSAKEKLLSLICGSFPFMSGLHRKKPQPRDTFELFVDIKQRKKDWQATCKMIHCSWKETAGNEVLVSRLWIRHFDQVHVAKWDNRVLSFLYDPGDCR